MPQAGVCWRKVLSPCAAWAVGDGLASRESPIDPNVFVAAVFGAADVLGASYRV